MHEAPIIDWRSEMERLATFARAGGGVVAVEAGPSSPASVFARTVRTIFQSDGWGHVQLEPSNENTHYVFDMLSQMYVSLGVAFADPVRRGAPTVVIGSGIEAGGDVEVSDIAVSISEDPFERGRRETERLSHLVDSLRRTLVTKRALIVTLGMHRHRPEVLSDVRRQLWDNGLARLTATGLVLIDISDADAMPGEGTLWPPPANLRLQLRDRFDAEAAAHAREDLRALAERVGLFTGEQGRADGFAQTLLSAFPLVRDLHARLASIIAGLQDAPQSTT